MGKPKLLGFIPQNFRVYGGRLVAAHGAILPRLTNDIQSQVVSVLSRTNPDLITGTSGTQLGAVKDFGSRVSISLAEGLPLSQVGTNSQRNEARRAFAEIARNVMHRVED